jgi:hypothetical protein
MQQLSTASPGGSGREGGGTDHLYTYCQTGAQSPQQAVATWPEADDSEKEGHTRVPGLTVLATHGKVQVPDQPAIVRRMPVPPDILHDSPSVSPLPPRDVNVKTFTG